MIRLYLIWRNKHTYDERLQRVIARQTWPNAASSSTRRGSRSGPGCLARSRVVICLSEISIPLGYSFTEPLARNAAAPIFRHTGRPFLRA